MPRHDQVSPQPGGSVAGSRRPESGIATPDAAAPLAPQAVRDLADSVRELVELCVSVAAPAPVLDRATATLRAVAAELRAHVPAPRRPHLADGAAALAEAMPFDLVVGPANPLAAPLVLTAEPPLAAATGTFPLAFQGAPGCVHGGAIAAAFDIVLSAANTLAGPAGPTVDLQVRFRRPTTIGTPVRFEAQVRERTDRRVVSEASLVQDGVVTATATGRFAVLTTDEIRTLARRHRPD